MLSLFNLIAALKPGTGGGEGTDDSNSVDLGGFRPPTEAYSAGSETPEGAAANLEKLVSNVIGFLTILGAIFFVIYFVTGALQWITSAGDKGKLETARNRMMNGVIGMVVIVASYAILGLLSGLIGFDLLSPGDALINLNPSNL